MGRRPEPIGAQSVRPGQHMIFSTESAFRLNPSFLKVAKFQLLCLFLRVSQVYSHEVRVKRSVFRVRISFSVVTGQAFTL